MGGSSLIPQVEKALAAYFPRAVRLGYPDPERALTAVSRGAALQSFFLHAFGRPLINPIAQESLGIVTQQGGFVEIVPRGAELPFPPDGEAAPYRGLVVPRDLMKEVQIVVAAGGPDKPLGIERLDVPLVRSAGEPIDLSVRLDANKLLTVHARLANHPDAHCTVTLENPLCAVAFGSERQKEIAELENGLAGRPESSASPLDSAKRERLARLYKEEGKLERAIEEARKTMEADRRPNEWLLNTIADCYDQLGAPERAEKHYREAIRVAPGSTASRFNLSLLLARQGRTDEAIDPDGRGAQARPQRARLPRLARDPLADGRTPERRGSRAPPRRGGARRGPVARLLAALLARPLRRLPGRRRDEGAPGAGGEPAPEAARPYDESRLPGQAGALARRAS